MSRQVFSNAGVVFMVFGFLVSVIMCRLVITTGTFGLCEFGNDHSLRSSELPDPLY